MLEHLREVEATLLDQGIDDAVHDGHQSQDQDGVKGLWEPDRIEVSSSEKTNKRCCCRVEGTEENQPTCIWSGWIINAPCREKHMHE